MQPRPVETAMFQEFDEVIVGAGSAGAVLAARLSEDAGRRVLLLEAGPDYPSIDQTPPSVLDSRNADRSSHDWGFTAEMVPGRSVDYPRGKLTGGSSAINAALALRGQPADYDEWATLGNPEWSWERVLPAFCRLEDDPEMPAPYHGIDGPIPIRRWRDDELVPTQRAFLAACQELGFQVIADHNAPGASGVSSGPGNVRDGVRISTAIAYLLPARTRSNLTIRADCLVDRVLMEGAHAVGVALERDGAREEVFGHRITLAAGSIGTPAILLRSGIGPADDLRPLGIAPVLNLPGVGMNLIDHALVRVGLMARPGLIDATTPMWQLVLYCTAAGSAEPNDLQITLTQHVQPPTLSLAVRLMRPHSRGTLRLTSSNPRHQPDIRLNLATDPEDERRLIEGLRVLCALAVTSPMVEVHAGRVTLDGHELSAPEAYALLEAPTSAAAYIRQAVLHYVHPVGTARMGPDGDAGAVVDQYGRVYGLSSLRVADASIMPSIPRANTNLACIMIGERMADWMRAEA